MRVTNQNIDTMYYHVVVTNEKCKNSKEKPLYPVYELDITEEKRVYEIVRKYNRGEQVRIKGTFTNNRDYPKMMIVQSEETAKKFVEKQEEKFERMGVVYYDPDSLSDKIFKEKKDTEDDITTKVFDHVEKETQPKARLANTDVVKNKKVFIVHGHDETIEVKASQLIKDLGLEPVILHEEPDKGQTIIEKLERCTDVGFGIILYTPCDYGGEMGSDSMMPRARQNVVFEHGMLIGKLGRGRVCALLKGDIEKPSDISGIIYKTIDDKGMWRIEVAKELDEAGYDVDMNKLLKIKKKM